MDTFRHSKGERTTDWTPLVAIVLFLCYYSGALGTPPSKHKLDLDTRFETPDSIVIGQPYVIRLTVLVKDTVRWRGAYPDRVIVELPGGCELLSGSNIWEGELHKGMKVTVEFTAVHNGPGSTVFRAKVMSGMEVPRSVPAIGPVPYGLNRIRSSPVKLCGAPEPVDRLDTLTVSGKPLCEKMKKAWQEFASAPAHRPQSSVEEPIVIGRGGDPRWSPLGERLAARSDSGFDIYEMSSRKIIASFPVEPPWLYRWYGEDTLALSYKKMERLDGYMTRISANGLVDFSGYYTEIVRDTAYRQKRTGITPWVTLRDGSVGYFDLYDDAKVQWNVLNGSEISRSAADTSTTIECDRLLSEYREAHGGTPSPDCAKLYTLRSPDNVVVVLGADGSELCAVGQRDILLEQDNQHTVVRSLIFRSWSPSSRFLTVAEEVGDGHFAYRDNLFLLDVAACELKAITHFDTTAYMTRPVWSPVADEFVISCPKLGGIVLWRPAED